MEFLNQLSNVLFNNLVINGVALSKYMYLQKVYLFHHYQFSFTVVDKEAHYTFWVSVFDILLNIDIRSHCKRLLCSSLLMFRFEKIRQTQVFCLHHKFCTSI